MGKANTLVADDDRLVLAKRVNGLKEQGYDVFQHARELKLYHCAPNTSQILQCPIYEARL